MNLVEKIFRGVLGGNNIRSDTIRKFFAACMLSGIFAISGIVIVSLLLTEGIDKEFIKNYLGFELFSVQFYRLVGIIFLFGFIASIIAAILISFPFSRNLKSQLQKISDANEIFSRGKLEYRIEIDGYAEIRDIGNQFNDMAQRTQKQVESLQRLITQNQELLKGAHEAASTEERRKIARELHDAISQQLFAISTTVSAIPKLMETKPNEAIKYLSMVEKMVTTAQQELRALIMHLRPVNLEENCLKEGIENLLEELDIKHPNIKIRKELQNIDGVSSGIENNIFRVTQEAVSNILRHSKATVFSVKLFSKDKVLVLIIEDNGIGIELCNSKKSSYGLTTMRERIEELGGRFSVISFPGKGTKIEIRVPIGLQSIFK